MNELILAKINPTFTVVMPRFFQTKREYYIEGSEMGYPRCWRPCIPPILVLYPRYQRELISIEGEIDASLVEQFQAVVSNWNAKDSLNKEGRRAAKVAAYDFLKAGDPDDCQFVDAKEAVFTHMGIGWLGLTNPMYRRVLYMFDLYSRRVYKGIDEQPVLRTLDSFLPFYLSVHYFSN